MVEYQNNGKIALFNGYRFVRDNKTGYYLSSHKIGDKRKRLHVAVWEYFNGEVPGGYEIHHCDSDKSNNDNSNFELILNEKHRQLHGSRVKDNKELMNKLIFNLITNAQPKAKKWHGSEEGRQWHIQNGKEAWGNRIEKEYTCVQCGDKFKTLKRYSESGNTFCGNNCKSAYRRAQGFDNETRACTVCGEGFTVNRYSGTQTCSVDCRRRLRCQNTQESKVSGM